MEFTEAKLDNSVVHFVGNKLKEDGVVTSKHCLAYDEKIEKLLTKYFLTPFKSNEFYNFFHDSDLKYNEVFGYVSEIFDDQKALHEQSVNLAKHLYEQSGHPKIKGGEFYVVYFNDCFVEGKSVDAIGIFKSETKETFLKVRPKGGEFEINSEKGININKLDKGCLIFNTEREQGYLVAVVDNTNKGAEAHYWIDDFLHVRQRQDNYYNTNGVLAMYKNFVTKELPNQFDASKADQADLLNRSVEFFKEKDQFDMGEFTTEVINDEKVIESFNAFKDNYQQERDIEISDNFAISETAVKKQAKSFKSVIKLDKNFHIYVHGRGDLIEQGEDDRGTFYKVYYTEET